VASHPGSTQLPAYYRTSREESDSNVALKLLALFLGIAVGAMIPIGIRLAASAQDATPKSRRRKRQRVRRPLQPCLG
jgi:hypothetical protein